MLSATSKHVILIEEIRDHLSDSLTRLKPVVTAFPAHTAIESTTRTQRKKRDNKSVSFDDAEKKSPQASAIPVFRSKSSGDIPEFNPPDWLITITKLFDPEGMHRDLTERVTVRNL